MSEVSLATIGRDPRVRRGLSERDLGAFVDAWLAGPRAVPLDRFLGVREKPASSPGTPR